MKITCIADLHGYKPELSGGDLLIITGDLTARDTDKEHLDFIEWIAYEQKYKNLYKKVVYVAGNHDNFLDPKSKRYGKIKTPTEWNIEYLCDSGTEFEGLKIWGSPWTKTFAGMNPHCKAFTCETERELAEKWEMIPDDVDILITHGPPDGILDRNFFAQSCGSRSLRRIIGRIQPKLWVFGHIHEGYGETKETSLTGKEYHFVNASHVNEKYQPVNKPIEIEL